MKSNIQKLLEMKADFYDREALAAKDRFNKGYFEGKAEQAKQTIDAIGYMISGNHSAAIDALNGDL